MKLMKKNSRLTGTDDRDNDDRWLQSLVTYLRSQENPRAVAGIFVDALAGEFDLQVVVGDRDPLQQVEEMSRQYLWAVYFAGKDQASRRALNLEVLDHVYALADQLLWWR